MSLEFETAETRYALEPADTRTPETLFEHRWALTVLDRVFRQIREEWHAAGKGTEFELLKDCLAEGVPRGGYEPIAQGDRRSSEARVIPAAGTSYREIQFTSACMARGCTRAENKPRSKCRGVRAVAPPGRGFG